MFRFRHVQTRIMVWIMVLVLFVTLGMGIFNCYSNYTSARQRVNDLVEQNSAASSMALENYIDSLENEVKALAASGGLTSTTLTQEQRQENLNRLLAARPDILAMYTIGSDGISVNDSDATFEDASGTDYSEDEFFQSAIAADGLWIDDPVYDEDTGDVSLTLTMNIQGDAGFNGVLGMDILYSVLESIVSQGEVGKTGYTLLLAEDGRIVTHPDKQLVLDEVNYLEDKTANPSFSKALETVVAGDEDDRIEDVTLDGETVQLYYHTIPQTGWKLVTIAKPEEFMGGFYESLRVTAITVGACLVLGVLIALFIGRLIARPITAMSRRMQQFAAGDLHSPMPAVNTRDELGTLHRSLDSSITVLNGYVSDISDTLERVSAGDITGEIATEYVGDFAPIKENLNRILASLNRIMGTVKRSSVDVSTTSSQMADAARALSENTQHQAATIETLSGSFGSIRQGLDSTAASTTDALGKTSKASDALVASKTSMDHMMTSMEDINRAAAAIEKIIQAIDSIAFQTNILALNAAVEAARAGQHGKGFAVVAEEVRSLASKSAASASQTAELIQNALAAVKKGGGIAKEAWTQIGDLETLVGEVTGLVQSIESAAGEQAAAAGVIYDGLENLSSIVQNDSAMAQQTAAASEELTQQAGSLEEAMGFFRLKDAASLEAPGAAAGYLPERY